MKRLKEVRESPPQLFKDLGSLDKPESEISVNSVKTVFEQLTGQKTEVEPVDEPQITGQDAEETDSEEDK